MIQDASDQQIKNIQAQFDLNGKSVLEIGCGKGRVTRDLAKFADKVIATDPDAAVLAAAKTRVAAGNVEFLHAPTGIPELPAESIDLVIYTLSLHHVPAADMQTSLQQAGRLLKKSGAILVLEPADGGTFNEAKGRFGVGSGNEGPLKAAALAAMQKLPGFLISENHFFATEFVFTDEEDFYTSKLHHFNQLPAAQQAEITYFLNQHKTDRGIVLTSERRINLLRPINVS